MRKFLLSAIALTALAGAAFAADLPSRKEAPVYVAPTPVFLWTGFYVGADVGVDFGSTRLENFISTHSSSASGVFGGGYVGYTYQVSSNFVLGVEGDLQGAGGSSSVSYVDASSFIMRKNRQNLLAAINGRLGLAHDRVLFYAVGGGAWAQGKYSYAGGIVDGGDLHQTHPFSGGQNVDLFGFDIGGGVEYAFNPNWVGRIEYRYYDFGPYSLKVSADRERTSINTVRVGLAYLFGAQAPVVAKY